MIHQRKDVIFQTPLGDVIRAWREKRKLTGTELAARAEIARGHLSEIEHNKIRNPSDEYMIRIAEVLDIPVEWLVMRRLPDEQLEMSGTKGKGSGGVFRAPIPSSLQEDNQTSDEALLQILDQIERDVKQARKLIRQKGKTR